MVGQNGPLLTDLSVWALHMSRLMLVAASFASSQADANLYEQAHTKRACPTFKIGTVNQQRASSGQSSSTEEKKKKKKKP